MSDDVPSLIRQIVDPRVVRPTELPNVIYLSERVFSKRFNDGTRIALINKFFGKYTYMYLSLDPMDADVLSELTQHLELAGNSLYHVPKEQNITVLYEQLYCGEWLLFFRNKPVGEGFSIPEGYGTPPVMGQSLLEFDIQLMIASGPDDMEWTVGWYPNQ